MLFVSVLLGSCKDQMDIYSDPVNRLNFTYESSGDTLLQYTFVYEAVEKVVDTLWIPVQTMGYVTDKDRKITLRQAASAYGTDAQAGVHFVPLDDQALTSKYYWMRAGENKARVPVVLKRDNSLQEQEYMLTLEIAANEDFEPGYPNRSYRTIEVADILTKPSRWSSTIQSLVSH